MEKAEIAELVKKFKIPKSLSRGFYLKPDGKKILKALVAENLTARNIAEILGKNIKAIYNIYHFAGIKLPRPSVSNDLGDLKAKEKLKKKEERLAQLKEKLKKEARSWPEPEILEVSEEAWHRPGTRRGYVSRWDYKGAGYRSGIILQSCLKFVEEGTHFNGVIGGLVNKHYIKKELHRRLKGVEQDLKDTVIEHFLDEIAREFAFIIPKIKKPISVWADKNKPEFVRFYISTSPIYDGPSSERYESTYGEEIARRLQALRPDDIRLENEGSARLEVKGVNEIDWTISPTKHRLPSKYYSGAAEREIEDKTGQSDQMLPDLWVVGTQASAIHKTGGDKDMPHVGEKDRPYITIPASCRLEATTVAENQEGVVIVESVNSNRFVRFWNFKDLIHREKHFITGIKDGYLEIHKKIVDVIKEHGAKTVGLLSDKLGIDRETIEREIKFLEEPKMLARKTWPGLFYNPKSQRYDFHNDWLQERLRYSLPKKEEYLEDTFLFFGCLHAGYTTTDYRHFVEKYPEIILNQKVKTLVGLGDFVAGLVHFMMHRGDIIGALNETDQQIFAAELVVTIIFKPFKKLFEDALLKFAENKPTAEELKSIVMNCLVKFIYIVGNHDNWPSREGNTPLVIFHDKLIKILYREIKALFAVHNFPEIDFYAIIDKKIIELPDFEPVCQLASGLTLGCRHPGMARADTTSLRAQKALDALGTQIVGIANFHVATTVRKWRPDLGQCVAAQAATEVIYTSFEGSKMKKLDFGPIFLRVLSHNKRIYMDETAYFNKPMLSKPYLKWIDVDQLKDSLGLLRA